MMSGLEWETANAHETEQQGASLATSLNPGDVVLVRGELGAGKTTFIRGACRALGVTEPITSPTFTIGRIYQGGETAVAHLDLYRLGSLASEDPALLEDYLVADRISFVEWPPEGDEVALLPAHGDLRTVSIEPLPDGRRRMVIE